MENCPDLKVSNMLMKSSDKEKYLGDYIQKKGNSKETTKDGNVLSKMWVILQDIH